MTPNQIEQMDDAGIVRLLAERVMGWTVGPNHPNHDDGRANSWFSGNEWKAWAYLEPEDTGDDVAFYHNRDAWNPLTNDGDCWQVVEALQEKGWSFVLSVDLDPEAHYPCDQNVNAAPNDLRYHDCPDTTCLFRDHQYKFFQHRVKDTTTEARRRAIAAAALKAVGVEVK